MPDELEPTGLKTWKRARPASTPAVGAEGESSGGAATRGSGRPIMCGGPEYTVRQRFELMRQRQREMDEAAEREQEEARKKEKADKAARAAEDEDDDEAATERFRNDRYAVGLLRRQSSDWGGAGGAGSGMLG